MLRLLEYPYIIRSGRILVPGGSKDLPRNVGLIISLERDEARLTLLTNLEVTPQDAVRLLRLNLDSEEYCYAADPEGYLAIILRKPVLTILDAERLRQTIKTLVNAVPSLGREGHANTSNSG